MNRSQIGLSTEGRFEQIAKMSKNKDKLAEYRRLYSVLLNNTYP